MTATLPDPHATQHDSTTDHDDQALVDEQTSRLRAENRALRDLLAAQVHLTPPPKSGCLKRIGWCLISAPGAALVGWRRLLGRDDSPRITGRRVGSATLTVLYTLAIYGALVLLVVSWNAPNNGIAGATSASPVRVPLMPPSAPPLDEAPSDWEADALAPASPGGASPAPTPDLATPDLATPDLATPDLATSDLATHNPASSPPPSDPATPAREQEPDAASTPTQAAQETELSDSEVPATHPHAATAARPSAGSQSTLRITETPAPAPLAWVKSLQTELDRCAALGFFDRPDCAWGARDQFCEPNKGWGVVKECPARP